MKIQGLEFVEALKFLADAAGVTLTSRFSGGPKVDKSDRERLLNAMQAALLLFQSQFQKNPVALKYCDDRGIPSDVLRAWEIGFSPESGNTLTASLKRDGHSLTECKEQIGRAHV